MIENTQRRESASPRGHTGTLEGWRADRSETCRGLERSHVQAEGAADPTGHLAAE